MRRLFIVFWLLCLLAFVFFGACDDGACMAVVLHEIQTGFDLLPWQLVTLYLLFTTLVIGLYLPGGLPLVILAGALFSYKDAIIWASIGNALGALIGCWLVRKMFYDVVQTYYGERIKPIHDGFLKHGTVYLLLLRLLPLAPSPVVNAAIALTTYSLGKFFLVTIIGRLPVTWLYVHLGSNLQDAESWKELMEGEWIMAIFLLIVLTWLSRLMWKHLNVTSSSSKTSE